MTSLPKSAGAMVVVSGLAHLGNSTSLPSGR